MQCDDFSKCRRRYCYLLTATILRWKPPNLCCYSGEEYNCLGDSVTRKFIVDPDIMCCPHSFPSGFLSICSVLCPDIAKWNILAPLMLTEICFTSLGPWQDLFVMSHQTPVHIRKYRIVSPKKYICVYVFLSKVIRVHSDIIIWAHIFLDSFKSNCTDFKLWHRIESSLMSLSHRVELTPSMLETWKLVCPNIKNTKLEICLGQVKHF